MRSLLLSTFRKYRSPTRLLPLLEQQQHQTRNYVLDLNKEPFQPRIGHYPIECDSAAEAVACVRSNMRIFLHGLCATPEGLIHALCEHCHEHDLSNIELIHLLTTGTAPQISGRYRRHFKDTSLFVSHNVRDAVNEGISEYTPIFLSEIPLLFISKDYNIDVSLLHVSPPDSAGFCSLGVSVDIARSAAAGSNLLVGAVNKHMPRTHGESHIHISQFDYIYQEDRKIPSLVDIKVDSKEMERYSKIGTFIANDLIKDGSTLQLGIGAIPQQTILNLTNHKNLGIHSEMFGESLLKLFKLGVISNACKKEHCGRSVASFVIGNQETYDFIDDNPSVYIGETNYVNDISVIANNPNVCAINSALEMDLSGQVVADSIGLNIFSGVGGQVDFLRGSSLSENGKPIICMTSTTSQHHSKIVPVLSQGAGVVTTRAHVRYVVTEYGCVNLFGKNLKERANLLISIAHPDHRKWLYDEAKKRFKGHWNEDQIPAP